MNLGQISTAAVVSLLLATGAGVAHSAVLLDEVGVFGASNRGMLDLQFAPPVNALTYATKAAGGALFNPTIPQVPASADYRVTFTTRANIFNVDSFADDYYWYEAYEEINGHLVPDNGTDFISNDDFNLPSSAHSYSFVWHDHPSASYYLFADGNLNQKLYFLPLEIEFTADATSAYYGDSYEFTISTVPEPRTWAVMLLGLAGLGGILRARRPVNGT